MRTRPPRRHDLIFHLSPKLSPSAILMLPSVLFDYCNKKAADAPVERLPPSGYVIISLERHTHLSLKYPGTNEVRTAERRKEIIQCLLVRQIQHRKAQRHTCVLCA